MSRSLSIIIEGLHLLGDRGDQSFAKVEKLHIQVKPKQIGPRKESFNAPTIRFFRAKKQLLKFDRYHHRSESICETCWSEFWVDRQASSCENKIAVMALPNSLADCCAKQIIGKNKKNSLSTFISFVSRQNFSGSAYHRFFATSFVSPRFITTQRKLNFFSSCGMHEWN